MEESELFGIQTVILLGEVAERTNRLEVVCRKCDRHGVLNTARLVREHGARFPMTELRRLLAGDCERFKAGKVHDSCGCHFPELPAVVRGGNRMSGTKLSSR